MENKYKLKIPIPPPAPVVNKSISIEIDDFLIKTATGTYIEINDLLMNSDNILHQIQNNLCLFNIINNEGLTINDKLALLKNIYEAKKNNPSFFYALNSEKQSILHILCEKGYKDIIEFLNTQKIDLNILNVKDSSGKYPAEYYIEKYISTECTDNDFYNPANSVLKNVSANEERKNYLNTLKELESIYDSWAEQDEIKSLINDVYVGEDYELKKKTYAYNETIDKIEKDNLPNKSVEKKRAELKFVNDIINWFASDVKVNSIVENNAEIQEKIQNEYRETEEKIKFELVDLNDKTNIKKQLDEINNKYVFEPMSLYYSFKSIDDSAKTSYIDYLDEQMDQNIFVIPDNETPVDQSNRYNNKHTSITTIVSGFEDKEKFTEELNKKYGEDNKNKSFYYDTGNLVISSDLKSSLYADLETNKKIFFINNNNSNNFDINYDPRLYVFSQKMEKLDLKMYIENYRTLNYFIDGEFIDINDKDKVFEILVLYDLCIKHLNDEGISDTYYEKIYDIQQNHQTIILAPALHYRIENLIQPMYNVIYFFKFIFEKNAIHTNSYNRIATTIDTPQYTAILAITAITNPALPVPYPPGYNYTTQFANNSFEYKKLLKAWNPPVTPTKQTIYILKEILIKSIYENIQNHAEKRIENMNRIAIFFMIYTLLDFYDKQNVGYNISLAQIFATLFNTVNTNNNQSNFINVFIYLLQLAPPAGAAIPPLIKDYYSNMRAQYGYHFINLIMILIEMHYMPIYGGIEYPPNLAPGVPPVPFTSYYRNFSQRIIILTQIFYFDILQYKLSSVYTSLFPDMKIKLWYSQISDNISFNPYFTSPLYHNEPKPGDNNIYSMEYFNPQPAGAPPPPSQYRAYFNPTAFVPGAARGFVNVPVKNEYAFYNNDTLIPKLNENLFLYSTEKNEKNEKKEKKEKKFYELLYDNVKGLLTNYYTFMPSYTNQQNPDKMDEYCNYSLTFAKKSPIYNELYRHINYNYMWNNNNIQNDEHYTMFKNNFNILQNQTPPIVGGAQPNDYFNIILNKNPIKLIQENKIVQAYTYKKININTQYIILRENVNPEDYQIKNLNEDEKNNFIDKINELHTIINDNTNGILYYLNAIVKYNFDALAPQTIFDFNYINYPDIISKFLTIYAKLKDLKHGLRMDFPENFGADFNIEFIKNFEKYKIIINNLIENIKKNISDFDEKINEFYLLIRNKIQLATNIVEYHNTLFSLQNTYYNITNPNEDRFIKGNMYKSYVSSDFPVINLELIPKTYKEFYSKYPKANDNTTNIEVNSIYGIFFKLYDELKNYKPLIKYIANDDIKYLFYKYNNEYYLYYLPIAGAGQGKKYEVINNANDMKFYNIKKYFPLIAEYYFNNLYNENFQNPAEDDKYGYKKLILQELFNIKFKEYIIDILYKKNPNLYEQTLINFTTSMYDTSINNAIIGDEMKNYKLYRNKCARETNDLLNLVVKNDYVMQNAVICVIQNKNNDVLKELLKITIPGIRKITNIAINKIDEYIKFIESRYKNSNLFYEGLNTTICNLVNSEQHKISSNINLDIVKDVFKNLNKYLKDTLKAEILLEDSSTVAIIGGFSQKKYKLKKIHNGGANITTATRKYKEDILTTPPSDEFQNKYKDFVDLDKIELSRYNILNTQILQILTESINRELKFQIINSLIYLFYPENKNISIMTVQLNNAFDEYFNRIRYRTKLGEKLKQNINIKITNITIQQTISNIIDIIKKYKRLIDSPAVTINYTNDYSALIVNSPTTKEEEVINNIYEFAENDLKYMILKYNDLETQQIYDKFALFKTLEICATNEKLIEEIDLFLKNSLYKQINALSSEISNVDYSNIMVSIKSMLMNVKLNEKVSEDFDKTLSNLFDLYKNWSATAGEVLYNSIKEYLDAMYEISLYREMITTLTSSP
jgi:hypothetical protein